MPHDLSNLTSKEAKMGKVMRHTLGASLNIRHNFFFQAEDGIRDHCVTGVQTCALPISDHQHDLDGLLQGHVGGQVVGTGTELVRVALSERSEERRVGKEWRCGMRSAQV